MDLIGKDQACWKYSISARDINQSGLKSFKRKSGGGGNVYFECQVVEMVEKKKKEMSMLQQKKKELTTKMKQSLRKELEKALNDCDLGKIRSLIQGPKERGEFVPVFDVKNNPIAALAGMPFERKWRGN